METVKARIPAQLSVPQSKTHFQTGSVNGGRSAAAQTNFFFWSYPNWIIERLYKASHQYKTMIELIIINLQWESKKKKF